MLQTTASTIDFDYFGYSLQRLDVYDQEHDPVLRRARLALM